MFIKNNKYSKKDIYTLLKVPKEKQRGAWDTGYRKYNDAFFIFANIGVSGRTGHDYDNDWDGPYLLWYGKTDSHLQQPLILEMISGKFDVHIFTRSNDRDPFTYQGLGHVKSIEDITPVKITWAFRKIEIVNLKEAWQILLKNAKALYDANELIISPIHHHQYIILSVNPQSIKLKRLGVQPSNIDELTYEIFEICVTRINEKQGVISRKDLYNSVILEAAIVYLLPFLDWDNFGNITVLSAEEYHSSISLHKTYSEAKNDYEFHEITRILRARRGQNKLRELLLFAYEGKCCISRVGIRELLHACHIIPHSSSGINYSTNALLLRADLHDLFDSNLIGINPKTMKVVAHKVLEDTEYQTYTGIRLCDRIDSKVPDKTALSYRWDVFNSRG